MKAARDAVDRVGGTSCRAAGPGQAARARCQRPGTVLLWLAATIAGADKLRRNCAVGPAHLDLLRPRRALQPGMREHRIVWQQMRRGDTR